MTGQRQRLPGGFRILRPLELLNWRPVAIGPDVPLAEQPACPGCRTHLQTLAVLAAGSGGTAVRVGLCPSCGYLGYRDRPTQEWISRYYAEVWSHGAEKDLGQLKGKRQKPNAAARTIAEALAMLPDRTRPIVEIGAGYGTMLKFVRSRGFENLLGLESSRRRAQAAEKATGLPMLVGDFESEAVQAELRRRTPIGLIYAFHVLEHTYDPADVIAGAAGLQSPGDLLLLGVPNAAAEPAMNILLFLPHLHAFTLKALTRLLGRAGYEIIDASSSDAANLNIIARKGPSSQTPKDEGRTGYFPAAVEKFRRELALASLAPTGRQRYLWSKRDAGLSGIEPYHWHWRLADYLRGRRNFRSLLIAPPTEPLLQAPFVISFASDPFLCIK